ncbi:MULTISPECIES: hypothetical protein [Henriciella]|uniref:hypothetical protein n=1 Tax=Henriciella TaxID=453849 RepID=UPI0035121879
MAAPIEAQVRPILQPYAATITSIMRRAWADWMESGYAAAWEFKRARANFVSAQMAHYARESFDGEPGLHIVEKDETLKFLADDLVLFRLKKADDTGLTANIPTQQVLAYHDHDQNLFGLPEVQRVDAVYILNTLETDIQDILVVARDGKHLAWTYSLLDGAEGVESLPLPKTSPPDAAPGRRLVRAKAPEKGAETKPRN